MSTLTSERVRELLDYDPETGVFRWRNDMRGGKKAGSIAGCGHGAGYWHIVVDGHHVLAHRLVWLHVHGRLPVKGIDHINGDRRDNRLVNLRECDQRQNAGNYCRLRRDNTSGRRGVYLDNYTGRWKAQIMRMGRITHIGRYDTKEEAYAAYSAAARDHFGEFANV